MRKWTPTPSNLCRFYLLFTIPLLRFGFKLERTLVSVNAQLLSPSISSPKIASFLHISQIKRQSSTTHSQFLVSYLLFFSNGWGFGGFARFEFWFRSSLCNVVDLLSMFIFVGVCVCVFLQLSLWISSMVEIHVLFLMGGKTCVYSLCIVVVYMLVVIVFVCVLIWISEQFGDVLLLELIDDRVADW